MLTRTLCMRAPRVVRFPPQTLRVTTMGRMACSARQLVASRPGQFRKVNSLARVTNDWPSADSEASDSDLATFDPVALAVGLAGCSMKEDVKKQISPSAWAPAFLGVPAPVLHVSRSIVLTHLA